MIRRISETILVFQNVNGPVKFLGPSKFLRSPFMASFLVNGRLTGYGGAFIIDDLDDHKLNFSQNCQIAFSDISVPEEMFFER